MNRAAAALCLLLSVPSFADVSRDELKKALDANPDLVLEALKKADKTAFFDLVIEGQREYQMKRQKEQEEKEKQEFESAFKNPYKPALDGKTRFRGPKDAPITIVEYSDFQCPFCSRGYQIMEQLREKHGKKIRFVFKHFPIPSMHPQAIPAARWMEAVALQSPEKAWAFHDKLFQNQAALGEDFYRKTVKELGLDADKAAKDAQSEAVSSRIEADLREAQKFAFDGTPGYLVNGIPVRGALPVAEFEKIFARLKL